MPARVLFRWGNTRKKVTVSGFFLRNFFFEFFARDRKLLSMRHDGRGILSRFRCHEIFTCAADWGESWSFWRPNLPTVRTHTCTSFVYSTDESSDVEEREESISVSLTAPVEPGQPLTA